MYAKLDICLCYGNYSWCNKKRNFYLVQSGLPTLMLNINVGMNGKLFDKVDEIEIKSINNVSDVGDGDSNLSCPQALSERDGNSILSCPQALSERNTDMICESSQHLYACTYPDNFNEHEGTYLFFLQLEKSMMGKKCLMTFNKFTRTKHDSDDSDDNDDNDSTIQCHVIHEIQFTIPELDFTTTTDCSICLENIIDDMYITRCRHIYHMNCIFEYLEKNKLMKKNRCSDCMHSQKIKDFLCPICRSEIDS